MTNNSNDIKLIAFDLDGTVFDFETGTMSSRVEDALIDAHNKGVKTCCVTGRNHHMLGDFLLNCDWLDFHITANGSCIHCANTNKVIWQKPIDKNTLSAIAEICESYNAGMMAMYPDKSVLDSIKFSIWISKDPTAKNFYMKGMDILQKEYFSFDLCDSLYNEIKNCNDTIYKIGIEAIDNTTLQKILAEFERNNIPVEALAFSEGEGEITYKDVTKGNAIRHVCEKLNLDSTKVVAFGDSPNDYSMCNNEWKFVAMGNADELIKQAADEICKPVTEDGVALWIEENIL